jgi:hypothetical protein
VLWFGGMFLALGVLTSRSFTAGTAPLPPAVFHAYFVAAALGMIGLVGLLIRRYRLGLGLVIGMLALGQVVTVAAVL